MFKNEWTLFIGVTFDAGRIRADREFCLFRFKTTVRIMTIAAFHRAFQNFVVKGLGELRFGFAVAADTELRFAGF